MNNRDTFAAAALQGLIGRGLHSSEMYGEDGRTLTPAALREKSLRMVVEAYDYADACVAERARRYPCVDPMAPAADRAIQAEALSAWEQEHLLSPRNILSMAMQLVDPRLGKPHPSRDEFITRETMKADFARMVDAACDVADKRRARAMELRAAREALGGPVSPLAWPARIDCVSQALDGSKHVGLSNGIAIVFPQPKWLANEEWNKHIGRALLGRAVTQAQAESIAPIFLAEGPGVMPDGGPGDRSFHCVLPYALSEAESRG